MKEHRCSQSGTDGIVFTIMKETITKLRPFLNEEKSPSMSLSLNEEIYQLAAIAVIAYF